MRAIITFFINIVIISLFGIFTLRRSIIHILISIELWLLAIGFLFIMFSVYLQDIVGIMFAMCILTTAGAESAIGLALLISFYRLRGSINISDLNTSFMLRTITVGISLEEIQLDFLQTLLELI